MHKYTLEYIELDWIGLGSLRKSITIVEVVGGNRSSIATSLIVKYRTSNLPILEAGAVVSVLDCNVCSIKF